jgi:hypothetical protein
MRAALPSLFLLACATDPSLSMGSAFTLQVTPVLPDGQDPFAADTELTVRITQGDDLVDYPLGASPDATWELPEAPPMADATIAMYLTDPNGQIAPDVDYADLRAFGQTPPVTIDAGTAAVPILLANFGAVGGLGTLDLARATYGAAAAVLPDGDVVLFGGTFDPLGISYPASSQILRLSRLNEDLRFSFVGDMPRLPSTPPERVGATATVVQVDGRPQVLVAGGRRTFTPATAAAQQAFLWDPDTSVRTWNAQMFRDRSQHVAVPMATGDVLMLGGFTGTGRVGVLDFEWFRAADSSFEPGAEAGGVGGVGFGWATLGDLGVFVCGGGVLDDVSSDLQPQSACRRISPDGVGYPIDDVATGLPGGVKARAWTAMAPLAGNRFLLCGGVDQSIPTGGAAPAKAEAWIYDATNRTWQSTGALNHPRAMHSAVPLPDGRVMILGGLSEGVGLAPLDLGEPVLIPEVYDPNTGAFSDLEPTAAGAGGLPAVASARGHGAWVIGGLGLAPDGLGYGIVGTGP